jgi:heptosyltransferase-2
VPQLSPEFSSPPVKPGHVVVLRADRLGDLILTTPLLRALASAGWQVSVVCRRDFLPILENNPHVASAHGLEDLCPCWPQGWWSLARHLRHARYDVILIPQAAPPALTWASACSGVPRRVVLYGGQWASVTFHERVPMQLAHGTEHYSRQVLSLTTMLGITATDIRPEIFLRESELAAARQALREHLGESCRPLVVLHAGGGHLRSTQRSSASNLPVSEYIRLAALLLDQTDCRIIITGGQDEASQLEPAWASYRSHPRCWYAVGAFGLRELAAIFRLTNLIVIGSTGPLHLASAVGATTLSPFCTVTGNNAGTWGNQGGRGHVIEYSPDHRPALSEPSDSCGHFQDEITADHFFARAKEILQVATPSSNNAKSS